MGRVEGFQGPKETTPGAGRHRAESIEQRRKKGASIFGLFLLYAPRPMLFALFFPLALSRLVPGDLSAVFFARGYAL
jgi:hypothetical protein